MASTLLSAYGWFAGLLIVMMVVTALFALILWLALRPIKKDELDESSSAKKALGRRETELTIELLNKQNSEKERAALEGKLREVKSAEKLVNELMEEGEWDEKPVKPEKKAKPEDGEEDKAKSAVKPDKKAPKNKK